MPKELIIIAGVAKNNVIGSKNKLPWHIKEDLKRFKELTFGYPVIMGRKTYESIIEILGKPLPGRTNIIITRQNLFSQAIVTNSLEQAISKAHEISDKAFIIGGEQIYKQAMPLANKLEITHIHKSFEGGAFFPEISKEEWLEIKTQEHKGENLEFTFSTYEKKPSCLKIKKGLFIAFEGIDGSGKSTQIKELVHHIYNKSKYNHVILTRNPYKNVNIREILHQDEDPYSQAEKLANLFIEDRKLMAKEIVNPNLEKGLFVIADRYKLSTIAYQSAQGIDMNHLIEKQNQIPNPDITFIIDLSPETAMKRMKKDSQEIRGKEHKFEANLDFIKKLRENYLQSAKLMKNIFVINGERTKEEISKEIKTIFDSF